MTNASDGFLSGGQSLNYGPTTDTRWQGRPRGGLVIDEPREVQQTDINTRAPLFWDEARTQPKTQLVFTVVCDGSGPAARQGWQTDERRDPGDAGHRQVYIKGKDKIEAIKGEIARHGLAQQGRPGIRPGDYYYECWTGTRPGQNNIGTARTWAVMLFPGAGIGQTQFFGNEPQPAPSGLHTQAHGFAPQQPAAPSWDAPVTGQQPVTPQMHAPAAQGNAYGFGHQPPASPGGQAFQNAQQAPQSFAQPGNTVGAAPHPGPPPQFQAPQQSDAPASVQQYYGPTQQPGGAFPPAPPQGQPQQPDPTQYNAVAAQQVYAPQEPSSGFGPPVPPVDNPWGSAAPAQNPYA